MPEPGKFAIPLLAVALAVPLAAQQPKSPPESAQQLARDVIWNELHDRNPLIHWQYLSTRTSAGQTLLREHVETSDGPVSRVLERNGVPLTADEQQQETQRLDAYIHDRSAVARLQRDHQQDKARLTAVLQMIPDAFLFTWQGEPSGDVARLSFRPNPAFDPSGCDARILHALTGTLTVNLRYKRLVEMQGTIARPVDIGYGLLGSIKPGGTFEIHRRLVSPTQWKTDLIEIHVRGRILLMKGISKDEREARSDFRQVPENLTLAQANSLLSQAAAHSALQVQLGAATISAPTPALADAGLSPDRQPAVPVRAARFRSALPAPAAPASALSPSTRTE